MKGNMIGRAFKRCMALVLSVCLVAGMLAPAQAYTHEKAYQTGYNITKGIDVSHWQYEMNWSKAKKAGVTFAILRCGYTSLANFTQNTDREFYNNLKNARKQGIPVGVYYFSQAKSVAEAKKEAQYVLKIMKDNKITLPIFFDPEDSGGRFRWKSFSKKQCTSFAIAFCDTIKAGGYQAGVYNSTYWFATKFNVSDIQAKGYPIWVAHYGNTAVDSGYSVKGYSMWQYSSKGKGSTYGAQSQYIDLDFRYQKKGSPADIIMPPLTPCDEVEDNTAITALTLDKSTLTLTAGKTATLTATVTPSTSKEPLSWQSDCQDIAFVDDNGTVTAVQAGTATITACSATGKVTAQCSVTVTGQCADEVKSYSYGVSDKLSEEGVYTTAENEVLSVTEEGVLTFKRAGVATVTLTQTVEAPTTDPVEPDVDQDNEDNTSSETTPSVAEEETSLQEVDPADGEAEEDSSAEGFAIASVMTEKAEVENAEDSAVENERVEPEATDEDTDSEESEEEALETSETTTTTKTICIVVKRVPLDKGALTLQSTELTYTGKALKPAVKSVLANQKALKESDYTLFVNDNINRGKATAAVIGRGNYYGVAQTAFYIRSKQNIWSYKETYQLNTGATSLLYADNLSEYGGKLTYTSSDPTAVTISATGKLTAKKAGGVKITVTAAKNDRYQQTSKSVTVVVVPQQVKLSTLTAGKSKGTLTAKWAATPCSGYEVQFSTAKKLTSATTVNVSGQKTLSRELIKLKSKKAYYVRVRAYQTVNGKKYYGAWSAVKSAKTR